VVACFVAELVTAFFFLLVTLGSTHKLVLTGFADPNRAGTDADSSDHHSGDQHLAQVGAQHRPGAVRRRAVYRPVVAQIQPKDQTRLRFRTYCERNLIERFLNKFKHFRAIATRYDKLARNFLAAVQRVSVIILLN
jgi:transposase